jgi:glycogen debranching enzyme
MKTKIQSDVTGSEIEMAEWFISESAAYVDDRTHVLNHYDTFAILGRSGDIRSFKNDVQGIYHKDTRYVSRLELKVNGERPRLLSSTVKEENEVLSIDLAAHLTEEENGVVIQREMIHIHRSQFVLNGLFHEKIDLVNHNMTEVQISISLEVDGDFKDIFEVRGLPRENKGTLLGHKKPDSRNVQFSYLGLDDVVRKSAVEFNRDYDSCESNGRVCFYFLLKPDTVESLEYSISFQEDNETVESMDYKDAWGLLASHLEKSNSYFPDIETSNEQFTHWINRSRVDLVSLMVDTPTGKYPYAGVPWYNTAFGRDGIITALETLWLAPNLSRDVLLYLAANQAEELDESKDAEPGKIMHETRGGEMVALNEVPFKRYYGTIDATPLFVVLAGEYYSRTEDLATIKKIWPNLVKALDWINKYGDLDGDGFVEYQHKALNGLTNQGWKDSFDSIFHANGKLADPPIALCEVQAYVYCAKIHLSRLANLLSEKQLAETCRQEAKVLKDNFNEKFWDKELECYVLALDGNKQPCRVKSSNAGHVLFCGIADPGKAKKLVATLLKPDMFCGWGIRTLSSEELRYNPMSYHNGSVWPHDVALIAEGMGKYGFQKEASMLLTCLFEASLFSPLQRLPELFCGMDRRKGEGPTSYPVACSPQAWSVATVFILLKAVLQIRINPAKKEVLFQKPILPPNLKYVVIKNLQIDGQLVELEIIRHRNNMVGVNWNHSDSEWNLTVVK